MMNQHTPSQVSAIISTLGGPSIQVEDIEWAMDLPTGKKLVDWIAAQLLDVEIENGTKGSQAALRNIALEAGELDILKHAGPRTTSASLHSGLSAPIGYFPPSRTNKHTEYIDNETQLLEEETLLLKSRLRQTKLASQAMSKTIASLQGAIAREDEQTDRTRERLAELSIQSDATIQSTMDNALSLLQSLGCPPEHLDTEPDPQSQLGSAATSLGHLASIRSSIVYLYSVHLGKIEQGAKSLPRADEIKIEATQLHSVLNAQFIASAQEAAFKEQINAMCEMLEAGDKVHDVLKRVLGDADGNGTATPMDIRGELEKAWYLDQSKILESKEKLLDMIIASYREDLMEPLNVLHTSLSSTDEQMRNSEVLLGAFGVELEELVDDIRVARENSQLPPSKSAGERADEYLEAKLTETLKKLKDMRATNASPLILLQRSDILDELRGLVAAAQDLQIQEEKWGKDLPLTLSSLSAAHAPLLSSLYEHSIVNTSPPFAFPAEVSRLEDDAKRKGDDLSDNVGRLQQELESLMENNRTKRKLAAFTDKWRKA